MQHELAAHALSSKKPKMPKMMKEFHAKQMHSGGYHVTKTHDDGQQTTHGAKSMNALKKHMQEHMAMEEMAEGGTGDPEEEMQEGE